MKVSKNFYQDVRDKSTYFCEVLPHFDHIDIRFEFGRGLDLVVEGLLLESITCDAPSHPENLLLSPVSARLGRSQSELSDFNVESVKACKSKVVKTYEEGRCCL